LTVYLFRKMTVAGGSAGLLPSGTLRDAFDSGT